MQTRFIVWGYTFIKLMFVYAKKNGYLGLYTSINICIFMINSCINIFPIFLQLNLCNPVVKSNIETTNTNGTERPTRQVTKTTGLRSTRQKSGTYCKYYVFKYLTLLFFCSYQYT